MWAKYQKAQKALNITMDNEKLREVPDPCVIAHFKGLFFLRESEESEEREQIKHVPEKRAHGINLTIWSVNMGRIGLFLWCLFVCLNQLDGNTHRCVTDKFWYPCKKEIFILFFSSGPMPTVDLVSSRGLFVHFEFFICFLLMFCQPLRSSENSADCSVHRPPRLEGASFVRWCWPESVA